jgi:hypothetical protein
MDRVRRALDRRLSRARRVEPFVRRLVAGGLALVAGAWLVDLAAPATPPALAGLALVVAGVVALVTAIRSQIVD